MLPGGTSGDPPPVPECVATEGGGKVGKVEYWGVKNLAYKIKKNRKAHFALLNIDAPPAAVTEMERRMRLSNDVIRFLTIRVEAHETEPSALMRKADRDALREKLAGVDPDELSPRDALSVLYELRKLAKE